MCRLKMVFCEGSSFVSARRSMALEFSRDHLWCWIARGSVPAVGLFSAFIGDSGVSCLVQTS